MLKNDSSDMKTIGLRVRSARSLVALNRKDFCEKHDLNFHTVQSWEIGRNLSRGKSLAKFCDALGRESVFCTQDWLLTGSGQGPYRLDTSDDLLKAEKPKQTSEEGPDFISLEAKFFTTSYRKNGLKAVVTSVADDAVHPVYKKGEFVGGILVTGKAIDALLGELCIIQLSPEKFTVRRLLQESNRYLLLPANLKEPLIGLDKIMGAAEIIWHRRQPQVPYQSAEV